MHAKELSVGDIFTDKQLFYFFTYLEFKYIFATKHTTILIRNM